MKPILFLIPILFASCTLFERQERLIENLKSPKGITVKIYFVELGATTNDVIQVRKVDKDNKEELVKAYVKNYVNKAEFINNDTLQLILSDTSFYGPSKKSDTIRIKIK